MGAVAIDQGHVLAVAGVVRNAAGDVLLVTTEEAGWELPGGRVELGEDLVTALRREIREEACCQTAVERLTGVYSGVEPPHLVMFIFRCTHIGGEAQPGDDSLDAGWFAPDDALRLVTHPAEHARLRHALESRDGVIYQSYRLTGKGSGKQSRYEVLVEHRW